jgi:hypothetical protein
MSKSRRPNCNLFGNVHFGLPDASLFNRRHDVIAVAIPLCSEIDSASRNIGLRERRWTQCAVMTEDR